MVTVCWHGTTEEGQALMKAIASNCTCEFGLMGARISTCPPHAAFTNDQAWLDRLLCERRRRGELWEQEHLETRPPE